MISTARDIAQMARTYCEAIDGSAANDERWLAQVASLLPRLHAAVVSLSSGNGNGNGNHAPVVDLDARFELYTHLRELLGERDSYWMEFDVAEDGHSMSGSLADDLTDIYCELKHGLKLLDGAPDKAVDGWRQGFRLHWGQHLLDAERHLYALRVRNQLAIG